MNTMETQSFNKSQSPENESGFDNESEDLIKQLDTMLSKQKSQEAEEQTKKAELIPEIANMVEGNQKLAGDVDVRWKKEVSWTARDRRIEEFAKSQKDEVKREEDDYVHKEEVLRGIQEKAAQMDLDKNPELSAKIIALEAQLEQQKQRLESLKKDNENKIKEYNEKITGFRDEMNNAAKDPIDFAVENVLLSHPEINLEQEAKEELVDNVKKELEIRELENDIKEKLPKDQEKLKNKEEELKKIQKEFETLKQEVLVGLDSVERGLDDSPFLSKIESLRKRVNQKTKKLFGGDDFEKIHDKLAAKNDLNWMLRQVESQMGAVLERAYEFFNNNEDFHWKTLKGFDRAIKYDIGKWDSHIEEIRDENLKREATEVIKQRDLLIEQAEKLYQEIKDSFYKENNLFSTKFTEISQKVKQMIKVEANQPL